MTAAREARIEEAIDIAVPWSSTRAKCKDWWTPEIAKLKARLATIRHSCRSHPHNPDSIIQRKKASNNWRKAIRTAQWAHWEQTFLHANRATASRALRAADKARAPQGLPDIHGFSEFQGKCDALREAFFPANVTTPAFLPAYGSPPERRTLVTHIARSKDLKSSPYSAAAGMTRR